MLEQIICTDATPAFPIGGRRFGLWKGTLGEAARGWFIAEWQAGQWFEQRHSGLAGGLIGC
jgi:hypothetical protein